MTMLLAMAALAGQVALATPPPVRRGLAAYPRIARPATAAARRINAAVARLDVRVRVADRECRTDSVNPTSWTRSVAVPMRGPDFLAYVVADEVDCGGAHPSAGHAAIVYDLVTGAPVDWVRLLGARLAGTPTLTTGPDGVRVVTLDSPRLRALYAARYDAAARAQGSPAECLGIGDGDGFIQPMLAWPDAGAGGLVLQFDLNHAMQACSTAVVIPAAVLQREGAGRRLIDALTIGRRGAGR